jgi:SAM-dependent methyltransferase
MIKKILKKLFLNRKFNSLTYWESRYANGGNSGDGSYGRLSEFKSEFLNDFLLKNKIDSVVEMGCGDGHQLSYINYPMYLGLDVSLTIINSCKEKFKADSSKQFLHYKPGNLISNDTIKADLSLSLDFLYHIIEQNNYLTHLKDLFSLGKRFVIVYSTNFHFSETEHVLHRKFTDDVIQLFPEWALIEQVKNPFPGNGEQESLADFFVFENKSNG